MNEPSNFCNGLCYSEEGVASPVNNKLPYIPTGRNLEEKTLNLDGLHANKFTELDIHGLFGTQMTQATNKWFTENNKRTFIIGRSSYSGMGKFSSRWLGDNWSTQEYMGYSVTGSMAHGIMGIPMAGSDICGFIGDTTPELCARWYMLGAFYTWSRNHNGWGY